MEQLDYINKHEINHYMCDQAQSFRFRFKKNCKAMTKFFCQTIWGRGLP